MTSEALNELIQTGKFVVETTKVINGNNLENISTDGVHPSPKGYAAISEQMIDQLKNKFRNT